MRYVAQCTSGLQEVASTELAGLPDADIQLIEEGFIVFSTTAGSQQLKALPYLNNCFAVIKELNSGNSGVVDLLGEVSRDQSWHEIARDLVSSRAGTFRVVFSDAGQLVGGGQAMRSVASVLSRVTGLEPSSHKPDVEFWIIRRRSGVSFFCKRVTRRTRTERHLRKGELRPELAHLLCVLSEPNEEDVFLDPCSGSGAIPFARTRYPYNMIFIHDNDENRIRDMKQDIKGGKIVRERSNCPLIVRAADARKLDRIDDGFVHKVVTDPPWGVFDTGMDDIVAFYRDIVAELIRVVRSGGAIVMLVGPKDIANMLIAENTDTLNLAVTYDVLVSGQKASVVKWLRNAR